MAEGFTVFLIFIIERRHHDAICLRCLRRIDTSTDCEERTRRMERRRAGMGEVMVKGFENLP